MKYQAEIIEYGDIYHLSYLLVESRVFIGSSAHISSSISEAIRDE